MELPSKKDWPTYYKEIKRPQCIENIFVRILYTVFTSFAIINNIVFHGQKHLKRKESLTSAESAADVELVFSNALTFNHEHTTIWDAALLLRVPLFFCVSSHIPSNISFS